MSFQAPVVVKEQEELATTNVIESGDSIAHNMSVRVAIMDRDVRGSG